jgi:glycosyltransferase involved in cell wall biosynthesis
MARIGMNPARHRKTEYVPARVTVAMLVYLPHLSGYFEHRFDVVRLSIASLLANTKKPFDLLVFDNGCCEEVKQYLRKLVESDSGRYLITSNENIGKLGALRMIAGAALGEVLAYTDDDTFFYPGWLEAHLEILDGFPNVGMVSGSPERTLFDHGIKSNLAYARTDDSVTLHYGQTIPEIWEEQWARSLGKDVPKYLAVIQKLEDIILERNSIRVYATACHNQFVCPKRLAQEFLQSDWSGRLMGGMNEFDNAIDAKGYLRLTTLDRVTRLIGNIVSPEMTVEAERFGISVQASPAVQTRRGKSGILRWKPVRWFLQGLYNRLFSLLSGQSGGWYTTPPGESDLDSE